MSGTKAGGMKLLLLTKPNTAKNFMPVSVKKVAKTVTLAVLPLILH